MPGFLETYLKHFDILISEGTSLPPDVSNENIHAKLKAWENRCLDLIEKTSGKNSDYYESMKKCFGRSIHTHRIFGLEMLKSAKKDYETLFPTIGIVEQEVGLEPLLFLERLCARFHLIVRQLRERHNDRQTLDVNDEYDVQDLMYGLLKINLVNIRKEEWTPSYAGSCSRMDFLLRSEGIVVEAKKIREGLTAKNLANQLIVDIERYQSHPDCRILLCFIYDPEGRLASPEVIEQDLSKPHGNIEVKVLVSPKFM